MALAALLPSPPLLIMDLGRPERFYNMLRIFKPRSPMSMGTWCLTTFGGLGSAAVAADLLGRVTTARRLGAANAIVGGYLGSYTGVLLASTAVPVWARSRLFLGPIFVSTATLTGAATTPGWCWPRSGPRSTTRPARPWATSRTPPWPRSCCSPRSTTTALGRLAAVLDEGPGGTWFHRAKWLARTGLAAQVVRRRVPRSEHFSSVCFLAAALCYRFAWVWSGPPSADDDEAVARMARSRAPQPQD